MVLGVGCAARLFRRFGAAAGIGAALLAVGFVPPCSAARHSSPRCCCETACPGPAMAGMGECCVPATASDPRTSLVSQALKDEPARAIALAVATPAAPLPSPLLWFAHHERALTQVPPVYARICVLRL